MTNSLSELTVEANQINQLILPTGATNLSVGMLPWVTQQFVDSTNFFTTNTNSVFLNYPSTIYVQTTATAYTPVLLNSSGNFHSTSTATTTVIDSVFGSGVISGNYFISNRTDYIVPSSQLFKRDKSISKKPIRNSIKRALKLISNFGMEEDVKIFLDGGVIEVSHPDSLFKFVMKKYPNSIINRTQYPSSSTPYKLSLYTKTNVEIADLCVVAQDTPILDQVFSLALFVKTGNEEDILRKANFIRVTRNQDIKNQLVNELPYLEAKFLR